MTQTIDITISFYEAFAFGAGATLGVLLVLIIISTIIKLFD